MLQFAATAFLWGSALIAVPVILHLMRRRPSEKIAFPSFRFLHSINAARMQQRNSLRKRLILLLRALTIAALAAAFALPFLPEFSHPVGEARVILVDASMSMRAGDGGAAALEAALAQLRQVPADTVVAVGLVGDTTLWSGGFTDRPVALESFIRSRMASEAASDYDQALRQADAMLRRMKVRRKAVILVGDMQKLPWQGVKSGVPLAPGIGLTPVNVPASRVPARDNVWIETAAVTSCDAVSGRIRAAVTAVNGGAAAAKGTLRLTAGTKHATVPVTLGPMEKNTFELELKDFDCDALPRYAVAGLDVVGDVLTADNRACFPVTASSRPAVLITDPGPGTVDFVRAALDPDRSTACAALKYIGPDTSPEVLRSAPLTILRDAAGLTAARTEAIRQAVTDGGNLILAWDRTAAMKEVMRIFGIDVLSAEKDPGRTVTLAEVDLLHPPFRKFAEGRAAGIYEVVFHLTARLQLPAGARVMASFGSDRPAVAEFPLGRGTVYVLAFSPDRAGTDWPTRATFLPFWHELLKLAAARERKSDQLTASFRPAGMAGITKAVRLDGDGPAPLVRGGRFIPSRSGVYRLENASGSAQVFYVNHDVRESALYYMPPEFNPGVAVGGAKDGAAVAEAAAVPSGGRPLFWIFLVLALLCGGGELWLANRTAL